MKQDAIICLDIGGTHCRAGLVDQQGQLSQLHILSTKELAQSDFVSALTEKLREYIRKVDQIETHKMDLIIDSYKFRLIQLCKLYLFHQLV